MSDNNLENSLFRIFALNVGYSRLDTVNDPVFLPLIPDVDRLLALTGMRSFGAADNCPEMIA